MNFYSPPPNANLPSHSSNQDDKSGKPPMNDEMGENLSGDYLHLRSIYQKIGKKEQVIQIVSGIFIILTLIIEFIIFRAARRLVNFNLPPATILRIIFIFLILFIITILAIYQIYIITRWNSRISSPHTSLVASNYQFINHLRAIQVTIILILIMCIIYRILFLFYIEIAPGRFPALERLYHALLRLSMFLIIVYFLVEIVQLIRFTRKLRLIKKIERRVIQDFPHFDDLIKISEENPDRSLEDGNHTSTPSTYRPPSNQQ